MRKKRGVEPRLPNPALVELIQRTVASDFGIGYNEIVSDSRSPRVTYPIQAAMYLACMITDGSLPGIGSLFNKHHTTVLHARDKVLWLIGQRNEVTENFLRVLRENKTLANKEVDTALAQRVVRLEREILAAWAQKQRIS